MLMSLEPPEDGANRLAGGVGLFSAACDVDFGNDTEDGTEFSAMSTPFSASATNTLAFFHSVWGDTRVVCLYSPPITMVPREIFNT